MYVINNKTNKHKMVGGRIKIRSENSDTQHSAVFAAYTANNQNYIRKEMNSGLNSRWGDTVVGTVVLDIAQNTAPSFSVQEAELSLDCLTL